MRTQPLALASAIEPASTSWSKDTISALMKPRWKSVWMTPAAWGAVAPTGTVQPRDRLLQRLQVGQEELGVDGLDVVGRADLAVDVHHVGVGEHPDHLADRVTLADVGQELVAQPRSLRGAADDAGDVHERHRRRDDLLRAEDLRELVQPRVGHAHHADVRLDGGERVVRREDVVLGQGVEEGRLADIGQADDPDGETHAFSSLALVGCARPTAVFSRELARSLTGC